MKIRPVGGELFHADRRTDEQKKLMVTFRNFANKLKNAPYQDNVKEDTLTYVINSNTIDQICERL